MPLWNALCYEMKLQIVPESMHEGKRTNKA